MSNEMDRTPKQRIIEILNVNQFTSIDDLTDMLIANNFWDGKEISDIVRAWQKAETRKWVKTLKDEQGRPAFANIEIENEQGESVHVYMQPALFDVEQYKQVISYHIAKAKHHANEAREFQKELLSRYKVQVELPFPSEDAN